MINALEGGVTVLRLLCDAVGAGEEADFADGGAVVERPLKLSRVAGVGLGRGVKVLGPVAEGGLV